MFFTVLVRSTKQYLINVEFPWKRGLQTFKYTWLRFKNKDENARKIVG